MLLKLNFQPPPTDIKLTSRGREVFRLVLSGLTDKEIAHELGITYSGVRRHREKMLLANGCKTMNELISRFYGYQLKFFQLSLLLDVLKKRLALLVRRERKKRTVQ